ncbi:MAG: hypothetical protein R6U96_04665 [Promethearchaeia archaeon]
MNIKIDGDPDKIKENQYFIETIIEIFKTCKNSKEFITRINKLVNEKNGFIKVKKDGKTIIDTEKNIYTKLEAEREG